MMIAFLPLYFTPLLLFLFTLVLIIGVYSFVRVFKIWKLKQIGSKDLITGLIISVTLYALFKLIYPGEKGTFSMIFIGPFLMMFLPFIVHFVTKDIKKMEFISKISLLAISYTMIGMVLNRILKMLNNI